jgi:hypothetical protein
VADHVADGVVLLVDREDHGVGDLLRTKL